MKQATADFASEVGGPITRDILNSLRKILSEDEYRNITVDLFTKKEHLDFRHWHCDFFSTFDAQKNLFVRANPGLETDTRIFLISYNISPVEFLVYRNERVWAKLLNWEQLSRMLNVAYDRPNDRQIIPPGFMVEIKGNELYTMANYYGGGTDFKYFMRVYLFPEGHSQRGKYCNELLD
jgi:hypothetical protein